MREHGGNIDVASAKYGFASGDMLDLSTGISPFIYPLPPITVNELQPMPTAAALDVCIKAARHAYGVPDQLGSRFKSYSWKSHGKIRATRSSFMFWRNFRVNWCRKSLCYTWCNSRSF